MLIINQYRDIYNWVGNQPVLSRENPVGTLSFISATLSQRISNADELTITVPGKRDVKNGDLLSCWSDSIVRDGSIRKNENQFVGNFIVHSIERMRSGDGKTKLKVSATAEAGAILYNVGCPSFRQMQHADLYEAIRIINEVVNLEGLGSIDFRFVNPVNTGYLVTSESTLTLLETLGEALIPSLSRWRTRPDRDIPTIEIGRFGDHSGITIHFDARALVQTSIPGTYSTSQFTTIESIDDAINSVFAEGGTWTDDKGKTTPLILWHTNFTPGGFHKRYIVYAGGGAFRLDKINNDDNLPIHNRMRRSRRLIFSGIVPETTQGAPPSGAQVTAAAQILEDVAADYLAELGDEMRAWSGTINDAFTHIALVGDKVRLNVIDEDGLQEYEDDVFVTSKTTLWNPDQQIVTNIELSTRLESPTEPMSLDYTDAKMSNRIKANQNRYTDSISCNPTGTYSFPFGYMSPPAIEVVSVTGGCTAAITTLTSTEVTFTISGCGGAQTVTFNVFPPL